MRKRITIASMVILLCLGNILTACGKSSPSAAENNETEKEEVAVDQEGSGAENTSADVKETDKLSIFINMPWYEVDSFTGIIPDEIKRNTGVDLDVTLATDANQLGVMIGSGDLPDMIFTDVELDRLSNSSLCYSYTELEEEFGASFAEKDDEYKNIGRALSADGDYYTMLNVYSTNEEMSNLKVGAPGQCCIYYRKDLMEQLGNPKMETVEDFMGVLEQCKTEFPDKVPLGLGGVWKFQWLTNWLGLDQYNPETGDFYFDASAPKYKDFLKTANTFARNGYVTAEAYANEIEADSHQQAYNDECVFYVWYISSDSLAGLNKEIQKVVPEAEWGVLPRLSQSESYSAGKGWAGAFVSRNCSNPEAAAKLLTYLHSTEGSRTSMWGREGVEYELDADGVPQFTDEFLQVRSDGKLNEVYNFRFNFGSTSLIEIYLLNSGLDPEILEAISTYGKTYVNYPEVAIAAPKSNSDEGVILAKLNEIVKSYDAKVIFAASDEEFESCYQEYMDALKQSGVEQYNSYMEQAIKDAKEILE